uniref:Ribosomal protein L6 n=1 Tax=Haplomitrium mnioides TaxID=56921 RepID=A0A6C0SK14_9MARC|nr:ribosomal protein L6 [Haplomitrium mnioides]QIA60212.1 ribosomal protein L6 [Haplomitrium mnioides]
MEAKFLCFLEIIGVGYKASTDAQGSIPPSKSGSSHEIRLQVTPPVRVFRLKPNPTRRTGMDHQKVTQFAAIVRSCKPPEVFKGKGIQYRNEIIREKQGRKK